MYNQNINYVTVDIGPVYGNFERSFLGDAKYVDNSLQYIDFGLDRICQSRGGGVNQICEKIYQDYNFTDLTKWGAS